jgi:hypothetical protein
MVEQSPVEHEHQPCGNVAKHGAGYALNPENKTDEDAYVIVVTVTHVSGQPRPFEQVSSGRTTPYSYSFTGRTLT